MGVVADATRTLFGALWRLAAWLAGALLGWRDSEEERLRRQMAAAETHEEWAALAARVDSLRGADTWRRAPAGDERLYDEALICARLAQLERLTAALRSADDAPSKCGASRARAEEAAGALMFFVRAGMLRCLGGVGRAALHARSLLGTKEPAERYLAALCAALDAVASSPAVSPRVKAAYFAELQQTLGRTALVLHGGATLGLCHFGVMQALQAAGVFPPVLVASYVGALCAAYVAVQTPSERARLFSERRVESVDEDGCGSSDMACFGEPVEMKGQALDAKDPANWNKAPDFSLCGGSVKGNGQATGSKSPGGDRTASAWKIGNDSVKKNGKAPGTKDQLDRSRPTHGVSSIACSPIVADGQRKSSKEYGAESTGVPPPATITQQRHVTFPILDQLKLNCFRPPTPGAAASLRRKVARLLQSGRILDVRVLEACARENIGDATFREAHERSGIVLNIIVRPRRAHEVPFVLNHLTAPDLLVWSAAVASCAFPLVFGEAVLLGRRPGSTETHAWRPSAVRLQPTRTVRAAPMRRIVEQSNVSCVLVSDVPSYVSPSRLARLFGRADGLLSRIISFLSAEAAHRAAQAESLGVLPGWLRPLVSLFRAPVSGDVRISPAVTCADGAHVLGHPGREMLATCMRRGRVAAWRRLAHIRALSAVEVKLNSLVRAFPLSSPE